eukprot:m.18321 g.18321  ORF g.18321 m.18321 type:complete len:345 (-) comp7797_c0_seq2:89-1123(-)
MTTSQGHWSKHVWRHAAPTLVLFSIFCIGQHHSLTLASSIPPLPPHMANHTFLFIVGSHHSGTTLTDLVMCQHSQITCLMDTGEIENEGQFLQNLYPPAREVGGMMGYGYREGNHFTETNSLVSEESRNSLWKTWGKYWDKSKKVVVEKSPPHIIKTRFFQELFTPERTFFIGVMRHPLACAHYLYQNSLTKHHPPSLNRCGDNYVKHWLAIYGTLLEDAPYLKNFKMIQYEAMTSSVESATSTLKQLHAFLGLPAETNLEFQAPKGRRALLGYNGDHHHIRIRISKPHWRREFEGACNLKSDYYKQVTSRYETKLNEFGYSLKDIDHFESPKAFEKYMIHPSS